MGSIICTETILLAALVVVIIFLVMKWMGGDPSVESPRSQMGILEELLRARGFKALVPLVRDFDKFNEHTFLDEIQKGMPSFSQDKDFAKDWLEPILFANLEIIVRDEDLLRKLDLQLRRHYGYMLEPIRHIEYGLRPQIKMHAATEEQDVAFREAQQTSLARRQVIHRPLETLGEGEATITRTTKTTVAKRGDAEVNDHAEP